MSEGHVAERHTADRHAGEGHVTSPMASFVVFLVLLVLLGLTVWASAIRDPLWGILVALAIATVKAVLIVIYFMNVRFADHVTRLAVVAGFLAFAVLLVLIATDYFTREWRRGQGQSPAAAVRMENGPISRNALASGSRDPAVGAMMNGSARRGSGTVWRFQH